MVSRTILRVGIWAGLSLACAMSNLVSAAWAQDKWPSRRVTIVVPFAAGSNTDACARLLAELLRDIYDQPFVIENRGGAGGTLGANAVAKSAPDGYTLLMAGNTSLSAAPALFKTVPYDPIKDFTAVARVGRFSSVLVATTQHPFRTIQEFVTYAKANPGKLSYGHGNSTGFIVGEAMKKRMGIDMARVPYTATPAAITDLLGGRTQMVVSDLLSGVPQIQAGKLVALATIFRERSSLLPEVPTLHETVMPGFEVLPWLGLFGPAGMPAGIVKHAFGQLAHDIRAFRHCGADRHHGHRAVLRSERGDCRLHQKRLDQVARDGARGRHRAAVSARLTVNWRGVPMVNTERTLTPRSARMHSLIF